MLYKKKADKQLDPALFRHPTSEYRGTPFWAWNCALTPELLERQIGYLKDMGFGGFHMHSRTGMATPYLSGEFMDMVKTCVEKARAEDMLAWLYDEDRWPSGSAGGLVTKNPAHRARCLQFSPCPLPPEAENGAVRSLLARYAVRLDARGYLESYSLLREEDAADPIWYAYLEVSGSDPWYNNQAYVNTLDKGAVDEFIRVTYEAYKEAVGEDFGGIVPAIFTDEPQFSHKTALGCAAEAREVRLPWTDDLPDTFRAAYGDELMPALPELFWELPGGTVSRTRYRYHDHIAQRFADAFANNCGAWCRENGLKLTGHMMEEPTLRSQTAALGDAMRSYGGFDLPGIDMLCDFREYNTAKQAQSAVHQYGREGMLSELYGVTNWDFDFRGHKLQGDWQAALGVTVRVPHLSWVSMEGEAKRDYPASISYQSPWFREYPYIEDHFARVNTALTRGRPHVRVGVIHPVESYWLHWGPEEQTHAVREQMDFNHAQLTEWLLFNQLDFDFIDEALLPSLCAQGGAPLAVGGMRYDAVLVPGCETLRASTAERLRAFGEQGGQLIVIGETPRYVEAGEPEGRLDFLRGARRVPFEKAAVLSELESVREMDIRDAAGVRTGHLLSQTRVDGDSRWVFIANGRRPESGDVACPQTVTLRFSGCWQIRLYDTLSGEIREVEAAHQNGETVMRHILYTQDSLLLCLTPCAPAQGDIPAVAPAVRIGEGKIPGAPVALSEPNVLLLDMAEYAFDGGDFQPEEEILRIDNEFRRVLGLPTRMSSVAQPWVLEPEQPSHTIRLRFRIHSETAVSGISLALERAEDIAAVWNGLPVPVRADGWYVDECMKTFALPGLQSGENILELTAPFGKSTNLEWCYLLGDFGVRLEGARKTVTPPVRELAFGDIVHQGLPFYGGNILYSLPVEGDGGDLTVQTPGYRGALVGVLVDGKRVGTIAFDPYTLTVPALPKGPHTIGLLLFGHRGNTCGAVHNCDAGCSWHGPDAWRTQGDRWSYEYVLKPAGILRSPVIQTQGQ